MKPAEIRDALELAARLEQLGVVVRSAELHDHAAALQAFYARGGNRALRRAAKRSTRKRGR